MLFFVPWGVLLDTLSCHFLDMSDVSLLPMFACGCFYNHWAVHSSPASCLWNPPVPLDGLGQDPRWLPPHTHTHWTSFQMATPALQETVKRHVFWPTPSQSPLSCCHRLPPLFQTWEFCVHHFQGTHCQALQVASFTSLSLRGSPQKPTSPLPAPPHPPMGGPLGTHSTATGLSKKQPYLLILLPAEIPFVIFHLPEGSKRHGASL